MAMMEGKSQRGGMLTFMAVRFNDSGKEILLAVISCRVSECAKRRKHQSESQPHQLTDLIATSSSVNIECMSSGS
jgi:hypothetical protein